MRGGPHLVIGAACGIVLAGGISSAGVPVIALTAAAALMPDLDTRGSTASRLLGGAVTLGVAAAGIYAAMAVQRAMAEPLPAIAVAFGVLLLVSVLSDLLQPSRYVEHRGPLHAPSVAILVGLATSLLLGSPQLGLAAATGWLSHLAADAPSRMGLPLLWPVSSRLVHLTPWPLRWRSGTGWIEWPLSLAALLLAVHSHVLSW